MLNLPQVNCMAVHAQTMTAFYHVVGHVLAFRLPRALRLPRLQMHPAFSIPEIAHAIVQATLSSHDKQCYDLRYLFALALTCRALCEPALDALWEEPDLWNLARRMSEDIWRIEKVDVKPELQTLVSFPTEPR
jgi:hypothetical protein